MIKNILKISAGLFIAGASTTSVQARVVADGGKKVLVVNQSFDLNGNEIARNLTLGEFRLSKQAGFQVQGLYTRPEGLVYSPGAAPVFPNIPSLGSVNGQPRDQVKVRADAHFANFGAAWGTAADPTGNSRMLQNWMRSNGISTVIYSYTQQYGQPTEFGAPSNGKIVFTKTISVDGKALYGKPQIFSNEKYMVVATYYPFRVERGMDPKAYSTSVWDVSKRGTIEYQVLTADSGTAIGQRSVSVRVIDPSDGKLVGAFDNPNNTQVRSGIIRMEDNIRCTYRSDSMRTDTGGPCRSSPDDLFRIMGRNSAAFAQLTYHERPEPVYTLNPDGTEKEELYIDYRTRTVTYEACRTLARNTGFYDVTMQYQFSSWLVTFEGDMKQLMADDIIVESTDVDFDIQRFTYQKGEEWDQANSGSPPDAEYNYDRLKAESAQSADGNKVFYPLFSKFFTEVSELNIKSGTSVPSVQIVGNTNPIRRDTTAGSSRVRVECTPEGDVIFFAGNAESTQAVHKYEETFYNARYEEDIIFNSQNSLSVSPSARKGGLRPYTELLGRCDARSTIGANGSNGTRSLYLTGEWLTGDSTYGNGPRGASFGSNCGTSAAELRSMSNGSEPAGCPAGFGPTSGVVTSGSCKHPDKTVCENVTTTDPITGAQTTTTQCRQEPDTTRWVCTYGSAPSGCFQRASAGTSCPEGGSITQLTLINSHTFGTQPRTENWCSTAQKLRLRFDFN